MQYLNPVIWLNVCYPKLLTKYLCITFISHLLLTGMFPNVSSFGACSESNQSKCFYTSTCSTDVKKNCKQIEVNYDRDAFSRQILHARQQVSSNATSNSDFHRASKSTPLQTTNPKQGDQIVLLYYL